MGNLARRLDALALLQQCQLAGGGRGVGRDQRHGHVERIALALDRRSGHALDEDLVLHLVAERHDVDRHLLGHSGRQGCVQIALGAVGVGDQQEALHGVAAEGGQGKLHGGGDVGAVARVADGPGIEDEIVVGDPVDAGLVGEADHADAVVLVGLALIVGGLEQEGIDGFLEALAGVVVTERCRGADVAQDVQLDALLHALPARAAENQHQEHEDQQADADGGPPADRAHSRHGVHPQEHNRERQGGKQQRSAPQRHVFEINPPRQRQQHRRHGRRTYHANT